MKLVGVGVSDGQVVAPIVALRQTEREPVRDPVAALETAARELEALAAASDGSVADILEAQAMLASDPELVEQVRRLGERHNPVAAVRAALAPHRQALADARSAYQRERVRDIDEIERRALAALSGYGGAIREPPVPGVLAAHSLSPADTGQVPRDELLGIVSGDGGALSHAAIVSRALGIPAVLSLGDQVELLHPGQWVAVNGATGTVELLARPPADSRLEPRAGRDQRDLRRGHTSDGVPVRLLANVGSTEDARDAARLGAEGCGLLRTEFLFQHRTRPPAIDEQVEAYEAVLSQLEGQITVRALDAGADKPLPFVRHGLEPNPALGRRGIRLLLARPDLLTDQARALCRCEAASRIRLMLPMVTRAREMEQARALLEPVFADEGRQLPIGAMIEVPIAALAIAEIAQACDFMSIGTNDLFQYLFAADRSQSFADDLIEPLPTAVWALLAQNIATGSRAGVPVAVCGELAADDHAGGILWALGADSLSVSPHRLPALKDALQSRTAAEWRDIAAKEVRHGRASEPHGGRVAKHRGEGDSA